MACHEVAALRLGLMNILGIDDSSERQHELDELGPAIDEVGPIQSLTRATNFAALRQIYETSVTQLEEKVARTATDDPKLGYYRTLVVLTKKVELDLQSQERSLRQLYIDLDEMHDFVHEIYPAE